MYGGRGRRGRRGVDSFALFLGTELVYKIYQLQHKPQLTLALMAGMSFLHLKPEVFESFLAAGGGMFGSGWGFDHVRHLCLHPAAMFNAFDRTGGFELRRLLISPFIHATDMHLYYNMASFLVKGVSLELTMGTHAFAGLLAFSFLASQLLMVLAAWVLLVAFDVTSPMHTCTVGFSGVLFALKYVLSRRSPGTQTILGFSFNTRYATWIELGLISLLVPNASFLGHLCGIMAGMLYVEVPTVLFLVELVTGANLARSLRGPSYTYASGTTSSGRGRRSYTYGSGTTSGRPLGGNSGNGRPSTSSRGGETERQPEPSSVYEEAAVQEALRLSLLEESRRGGRDNEGVSTRGVSTSVGSNGGSAGEATAAASAATEILRPALRSPTVPPSEEPQQEDIAGEEQHGTTSTASAAASHQNDLRRRRVERSGGVDDYIVL